MTQKIAIWAPSHNFVGLYLRNWGMYRQSEKNLLSSNTSSTCPDNMVNLRPTNGWDLLASLGHRYKFQWVFASWQRYCTTSSSGRQPNFAALNRGRHLCSAGRPSGWALAHILVSLIFALWTVILNWSETWCQMSPHWCYQHHLLAIIYTTLSVIEMWLLVTIAAFWFLLIGTYSKRQTFCCNKRKC